MPDGTHPMLPALRPLWHGALILAAPLALAACDSGTEPKGKDQRTAAGEILPGSISDAMIPFDTVRSQPPLAPKPTGSATAAKGGETADEGPGDPPVDPADAPLAAPAEEPAAPAAPTD